MYLNNSLPLGHVTEGGGGGQGGGVGGGLNGCCCSWLWRWGLRQDGN